MKKEITLSELIDGSVDNFKEFLADKDLGFVKSLKTQLSSIYYSLNKAKDDIIAKSKKTDGVNEEYNQCVNTVKGLVVKMMKIEELVLILKEEEDKRAIIDSENSLWYTHFTLRNNIKIKIKHGGKAKWKQTQKSLRD